MAPRMLLLCLLFLAGAGVGDALLWGQAMRGSLLETHIERLRVYNRLVACSHGYLGIYITKVALFLVSLLFGCLILVSVNTTSLSLNGGDLMVACEGSGILRAVIGSRRDRAVVADDVYRVGVCLKFSQLPRQASRQTRCWCTWTDLSVAAPLSFRHRSRVRVLAGYISHRLKQESDLVTCPTIEVTRPKPAPVAGGARYVTMYHLPPVAGQMSRNRACLGL